MEEIEQEKTLENEQTLESIENDEQKGKSVLKDEKVSFGKFKDAESLYKAYTNLEAEFTKRCQRIKELEAVDKAEVSSAPTLSHEGVKVEDLANLEKQASSEEKIAQEEKKVITEDEKKDILKDYLKEIIKNESAVLLAESGYSVKTPISRPKTFFEAGEFAKSLFDKPE